MRLDVNKPYGKWCPPQNGVFYEQNGRFFGVDYNEVTIGGKPAPNGKTKPIPKPGAAVNDYPILSVDALLAQAETMHYQHLRKAAKAILGENCPSLKADMLAALAEKAAGAGKVEAPPATPRKVHGLQVAANGVDLILWGTGKEKYLFGDVAKAIRELHHKQVDNATDAVNFLIDEEIVAPEEAIKV